MSMPLLEPNATIICSTIILSMNTSKTQTILVLSVGAVVNRCGEEKHRENKSEKLLSV
jgi:hypothetical protein